MRHITAAEVRQFLVERYAAALSSAGVSLDSLPGKHGKCWPTADRGDIVEGVFKTPQTDQAECFRRIEMAA
jgi:hypothetical protein